MAVNGSTSGQRPVTGAIKKTDRFDLFDPTESNKNNQDKVAEAEQLPPFILGEGKGNSDNNFAVGSKALKFSSIANAKTELDELTSLNENVTIRIDGAQGGPFYYDPNDTTSTEDGGLVFVTSGGKRIKRVFESVKLSFFGENQTALTAVAAITDEITIIVDTNFNVTANTILPKNLTFRFDRGGSFSGTGVFTLEIQGDIIAGRFQIFKGTFIFADFNDSPSPDEVRDDYTLSENWTLIGNNRIKKVYPEWFGFTGGEDTDNVNTLSLISMHNFILTYNNENNIVKIEFVSNSIIKYKYPHWMAGIFGEIEFNGSILQNVTTSTSYLWAATTTGYNVINNSTGSKYHSKYATYQIESTEKGDTEIVLKSTTDVADFVVGNWALVASRDQQYYGFPPNFRYFDYVKILDVTGDTITIDRPLRFAHKDYYPELSGVATSMGKAIIIPLPISRYFSKLTIKNFKIINHASVTNAGLLVNGNEYCYIENIIADTTYLSQCKEIYIKNIYSNVLFEADKITENITIDTAEGTAFGEGTGVLNYTCRNAKLLGNSVFKGKNVVLENVTHSNLTISSRYKTRSVILKNVSAKNYGAFGEFGSSIKYSQIDGVSGNTLSFTKSKYDFPSGVQAPFILIVEEGDFIYKAIGTNYYSSSFAKVIKVYDDATNFLIDIEPISGTFSTSDYVAVDQCNYLEVQGGDIPYNFIFPSLTSSYKGATFGNDFLKISKYHDINNFVRYLPKSGYITKIVVDVKKVYSGVDANNYLQIKDNATFALLATIDLKTLGRREIGLYNANGSVGSDSFSALGEKFVHRFLLTYYDGVTAGGKNPDPSDTNAEFSFFNLEIYFSPLI